MQVNNLEIIGRGSQTLAPASGVDLIRLQDVQALLTGYLPVGSNFNSSAVTNFSPAVLAVLAANGVPLSGVVNLNVTAGGGIIYDSLGLRVDSGIISRVGHTHSVADLLNFNSGVAGQLITDLISTSSIVWSNNGAQLSGVVQLVAGGGLLLTGNGLKVDSGIVSLVGHTHAQLHNALTLGTSTSLGLVLNGQQLSGEVNLQPLGGLLNTPSGVGCDFGAGHNQVMRGDALAAIAGGLPLLAMPVYAAFDQPNTVVQNDYLIGQFTLAAQVNWLAVTARADSAPQAPVTLTLEVDGSLTGTQLVLPSGVAAASVTASANLTGLSLNAGSVARWKVTTAPAAATSAARVCVGMTGTAPVASGATVFSSPTLQLFLNGNVLSGVVPLDANPPAGYGAILAGLNGLRVRLGTDGQSAAAGNHTHPAATESVAGFQSATDKLRLDTLWAGVLSGVQTFSTPTLLLLQSGQNLSGVVQLHTTPAPGIGLLAADAQGLYMPLGSGVNQAAAGNHTHSQYLPLAGGTMTGVLTLTGTLTITGVGTTPPVNPSGVAAWFTASVNGTAYKIPLYQ